MLEGSCSDELVKVATVGRREKWRERTDPQSVGREPEGRAGKDGAGKDMVSNSVR